MMTSLDFHQTTELQQVTHGLVRHYSWQWVTADQIINQMAAPATEDRAVTELGLQVEQAASALLYQGCGDLACQEAAFRDLAAYLTLWARRLSPPAPGVLWADLIQDTLFTVHQQYGRCRTPTAFLAWALVILRRAAAATWRVPRSTSLDSSLDSYTEGPQRSQLPLATTDPSGDQELLRVLHDCLDTDEERAWAVWIFVLGLKRREWSLVFDTPLSRYDTLGRQVKHKLRKCPCFYRLFGRQRGA